MPVNEYKLPDPGEGLTEAEIVSWKVKVGDTVKVNDVVVEVETAKSLVELPSPYAGTVTALLVPEGETVPVGTSIIAIDDGRPGGTPAGTPATSAGSGDTVAQGRAPQGERAEAPETGDEEPMKTLVGYGPRSGSAMRRARRGPATAPTAAGSAAQMQVQGAFTPGGADTSDVVEADEAAVPAEPSRTTAEEPAPRGERAQTAADVRVLAKPPVRKLAKDLGVDLRALVPSGPGGTVSRADVEQAAASAAEASTDGGAGLESTGGPETPLGPSPVSGQRERREPIKGVRKRMGQAMVDSAFTLPHVTEWVTVDVTRTMRLVERLRSDRAFADVRVSPLLVLAKAVCLAMRRTPEINAWWDEDAQEIVYKSFVNLGIAAATPRGLVVPNVKDAQDLSLAELGRAVNDLTSTAREGRTQPADMSGGTFTITNVGVFGVDAGTPIINPGESAIIAFGAVRKQPWVHKGRIKPRDVTTLALSFDHRFIDGAKGSRFLADVAAVLEDPASALLL